MFAQIDQQMVNTAYKNKMIKHKSESQAQESAARTSQIIKEMERLQSSLPKSHTLPRVAVSPIGCYNEDSDDGGRKQSHRTPVPALDFR